MSVSDPARSTVAPRIAVIGAGAVGGYFGGLLTRAGASVVLIGRQRSVDAINANGLFLDTLTFSGPVVVEASTELSAAKGASLVLFCVKTTDTAVTARGLAPFLPPEAIVLSLQNGVDNSEQIQAAANIRALSAVVYIAASIPTPGRVKHLGRGDLVIGPETEQTKWLAALFNGAGVPCRIAANIQGELWAKFLCNCALNAISALGQATYGRIGETPGARMLVDLVIDEVMALARVFRIELPGMENTAAARAAVLKLTTQIAGALSSTAQDLNRGKTTEIDSFNGFIVRQGLVQGVPTPANLVLFNLVKLAESRPR